MINYQYYPKNCKIPEHLKLLITNCFIPIDNNISSDQHEYSSNEVLAIITPYLEKLDYTVEKGKKEKDKIIVPVLYGMNETLEKYFEADALNMKLKTVIEVEAGRAVTNYQFLKDLFQASMMLDIEYLTIAVRNRYRKSKDFEKVLKFFDTLYSSSRLTLPLKGILIVGY